MILPKSLLDQVEYYEIRTIANTSGYTTKIVLHFKQWWKPRKVLKFKWEYVKHKSEDVTVWKPTTEDIQTMVCLQQYFKDK